jgi:hypothetical protein
MILVLEQELVDRIVHSIFLKTFVVFLLYCEVGCPLYYTVLYDGVKILTEYAAEDVFECGLDCQGDAICEGFSYWEGLCYRYSNIQSQTSQGDAISGMTCVVFFLCTVFFFFLLRKMFICTTIFVSNCWYVLF